MGQNGTLQVHNMQLLWVYIYAWYALVVHRMCGSRAEYVHCSDTYKKDRRWDGM